jgi:predicted AlkP superfamily pyrophosphatase or phosphodiesterase
VLDNDIAAPNYHYWNIFRLFKQQYPRKTTAVFSTWLDNRTKLIGSEVKAAGNLHPDFSFDGIELDTLKYPHDTLGHYMLKLDEAVTDTAASNIRRHGPDLTWIYLENTDEMGHRYGNGKEMDKAVRQMDKQLGRIWTAIQYRKKKFKEDWLVFITTDHGREENGYGHGSQSKRERTTWIATNAKGLNQRFKKEQPAIVDIMPSIASFMNIKIPAEKLMEIDGVSLIGKISATDASAVRSDNMINLKWKVIDKKGVAKIWLAPTNFFKTGGKDKYTLMKTVPVSAGQASVDISKIPSDFYKVVIEMPYNDLNRWIIVKNK